MSRHINAAAILSPKCRAASLDCAQGFVSDVWVQVRCLLTHWGRVTHICVSKLTIIGSDNGLSPARRQAIIWTNAGILLIGPLGTNFSEILIEILTFSFKKMHLKMSSGKWRPSCLGLNVLTSLRCWVVAVINAQDRAYLLLKDEILISSLLFHRS